MENRYFTFSNLMNCRHLCMVIPWPCTLSINTQLN